MCTVLLPPGGYQTAALTNISCHKTINYEVDEIMKGEASNTRRR